MSFSVEHTQKKVIKDQINFKQSNTFEIIEWSIWRYYFQHWNNKLIGQNKTEWMQYKKMN